MDNVKPDHILLTELSYSYPMLKSYQLDIKQSYIHPWKFLHSQTLILTSLIAWVKVGIYRGLAIYLAAHVHPTHLSLGLCLPIMLLKLPMMLWSNAPEFSLLCSNYAPLCSTNSVSPIIPKLHSHEYQ